MRLVCTVLVVLCSAGVLLHIPAFAPSPVFSAHHRHETSLAAAKNQDNAKNPLSTFLTETHKQAIKTAAAVAVAGALWAAPAAVVTNTPAAQQVPFTLVANAKDKASASGSRVNKDAESLLRYGLPINNKEVRQLQGSIEDIKLDIGSKRKLAALDDVRKSRNLLSQKGNKMSPSCRDPSACTKLMESMTKNLDPLEAALKDSVDYLNGSEQERNALDKAYEYQAKLSKQITQLEENMVPKGYTAMVPKEYSDLPQLEGRATVEFVLKKPDNGPFDVNGVNYPQAKMVMVIDGYAAPVTGGNFVDLVQKGFYKDMKIQRSDGFVVQTGDPDGDAIGYTGGKASASVGAGANGERLIPLEIFLKGDKTPLYETTVEDEGRGGEATVLPFSSYGAMGWARDEYEPNSGSSQFFWLLFESDLTPAGKNVLDGRYPCFGYVVEGADFLTDIKEGDVIVSAKVTDGIKNLKQP